VSRKTEVLARVPVLLATIIMCPRRVIVLPGSTCRECGCEFYADECEVDEHRVVEAMVCTEDGSQNWDGEYEHANCPVVVCVCE